MSFDYLVMMVQMSRRVSYLFTDSQISMNFKIYCLIIDYVEALRP